MGGRFDNIVNTHALLGYADGIGFKDITCLIVGKATAFNMIGVIGQLDLYFMINSAVGLTASFLFQNIKQRLWNRLTFIASFGFFCVLGYVPCFARKESTGDTTGSTIIPNATLGCIPK